MNPNKEKKDIVFVILHYLTYTDTIECVNSIKEKCKENNYQIIIVDNYSNNGSAEKLNERFEDDSEINILKNESNLGFAKANNMGIRYALNKFQSNFIVVLNNDTILLQEDTVDLIFKEYEKSAFGVLGPMIYTADGRCNDNPGTSTPLDKKKVEKLILRLKIMIFLYRFHLGSVYRFLIFLRRKTLKIDKQKYKNFLERELDVQLHGSFLVFSEKFFEKLDGFYDGTFLYMEEDILFYQCLQNEILTVYNPDIKIFHKEDSASKITWNTDRKITYNKNKYSLDSAKKLLELMDCKSDTVQ